MSTCGECNSQYLPQKMAGGELRELAKEASHFPLAKPNFCVDSLWVCLQVCMAYTLKMVMLTGKIMIDSFNPWI